MTVPSLQAEGLAKQIGGAWLFRDVSFVLSAGRSMAVVGENGTGKTTLLDVVSGDICADGGRVFLRGRAADRMPAWRRARLGLGRLYQDIGTFASLSPREALQVGVCGNSVRHLFEVAAHSVSDKEIDWMLDRVGLTGARDVRADKLSWGNQRLLAIARLLICRPVLLVLDEPLAGLSAGGKSRMCQLIEELKVEGVAVLLVEHDLETVDGVVDDLFRLDGGRLVRVR